MRTGQLSRLIGRSVELVPMPLTGRYPRTVVRWEVGKAGVGLALCAGVVLALRPSPWLAWPLVLLGGIFAAYLMQQLRRQNVHFLLDDSGITRVNGSKREPFRWNDLADFRLNYYPNGRKAAMGTLVLVLRNRQGKLKVDSGLDHFPTLLQRAAQAARDSRLELHPTTVANMDQLGL